MQVRQCVDEGLGDSTHLVISERTGLAAQIDPLRDAVRYLDAAAAVGVRISHVFETHLHADFVTGSGELVARPARGAAVVDIRPVARYLEGHIPGVYHVELRPAFAAWVGWVVPFGSPVVLVSETPDVHEEAARQPVRIGYANLHLIEGGWSDWQAAGDPVADRDGAG